MRAKTSNGENIDIEVQLTRPRGNTDKRGHYSIWGKMYIVLKNIKQGQDYTSLEKGNLQE